MYTQKNGAGPSTKPSLVEGCLIGTIKLIVSLNPTSLVTITRHVRLNEFSHGDQTASMISVETTKRFVYTN